MKKARLKSQRASNFYFEEVKTDSYLDNDLITVLYFELMYKLLHFRHFYSSIVCQSSKLIKAEWKTLHLEKL